MNQFKMQKLAASAMLLSGPLILVSYILLPSIATDEKGSELKKFRIMDTLSMTKGMSAAGNSVLAQLAVRCKIGTECYYQTFVLCDSEVLRNRKLRRCANRCLSY